ncbi:hypothetical protein BY458DRAFT_433575, partial [Sporodiniella umbellata]
VPQFSFSLDEITSASSDKKADDWNITCQAMQSSWGRVDSQENQHRTPTQPPQHAQSQWQQTENAQPPQHAQNHWQASPQQPAQSQWQQTENAQPPQHAQNQWQASSQQPAQSQWQQTENAQPPQHAQNQWQASPQQPTQSQWQQTENAQPPQHAQNQWQASPQQPTQSQWQQHQPAQNQWQNNQAYPQSNGPAQNQWSQSSFKQQSDSSAPQYDLINNPQGSYVSKYAHSDPPASAPAQASGPTINLNLSQITSDIPVQENHDRHVISGLFDNPYDVHVKVVDPRMDPDSPLYSAKSFQELGLKESLLRGLYDMGFSKPSKVQERALPLIISDPPINMIAQSQSGTGKTAAFVLGMLSRVDVSVKQPQAICLAPSRELARQIHDVTVKMAKFNGTTVETLVKQTVGKTVESQIIVGTPGKVYDLIRRKKINVSKIKVFVLDEADNMLDQDGLGDQSIRIKALIPHECQVLLFSATFPDHVREFASKFAPGANEMSLANHELSVDVIKQFYMDCQDEEQKYDVLCNLYELLTVSQSIIFCKRRETAFEIGNRMQSQGHATACLHGLMSPEERDKVMDDFRRGEFKVLITTNVISRGIDVLQVSLVVNYDMPVDHKGYADSETYLHRIGRTGRFGRVGVSILFVHDNATWRIMKAFEQHFTRSIERVPVEDWEEVERILKPVISEDNGSEEGDSSKAPLEDYLEDHPLDSEEIDLVHLKVSDLTDLRLERFKHLKQLCLRQNLIIDIEGLSSLSNLTSLDLYDNKISHIRGLNDLVTLTSLDLSFNKIKHVKNIEKLTELTDLYFVSNKISKIENLDTFPKLRNLELGANRIRVLENLDYLGSLTELWLGKNKITKIENLGSLKSLKSLSIQSNRLTKLEGLERLLNLEEIYLSHNAIEKIEGLENNLKLTTIDIAHNALTKIENLSHLPDLQELWANNNKFGNECYQQVEEELGKIKTLETVYLEGNPMQLENKTTYRNKIKLALPNIKQIDATTTMR